MIEAFETQGAASAAAAAEIERALRTAIAQRGRAVFVGTGGRTPAAVYERLRNADLDWSRVTVTLSDDRCVGPDAPESNARLVQQHLLLGEAAAARFEPLWTPSASPEAAALAVEPVIHGLMPFDVVLLGMGVDGHVASLIPGDPKLGEAMAPDAARAVVGVPSGIGSPPLPRVSLTFSALLRARLVLVLVSGEAKHEVVRRAQAGADLPVSALLSQTAVPVRVLWSP